MKKILILIFAMVIACGLSFTTYAEERGADSAVVEPGAGNAEVGMTVEGASDTVETVFTRLLEALDVNKDNILAAAGFIGTLLVTIFANKIKNLFADIASKILAVISSQNASSDNVKALIKGYNGQTDEITALKVEVAELRQMLAVAVEKTKESEKLVGHIAHILTTVYTNHKTLPQGVKDMINIECAQCMRIVELEEPPAEVVVDEVEEEN